MDWYMPSDPAHLRPLRLALADHLERHSSAGSDIEGALLAASELVTNAVRYSEGPVWISLDWGQSEPVLTVRDLGAGFDLDGIEAPAPDDIAGRGLMIASRLVPQLDVHVRASGGAVVTAVLPVSRADSESFDPPPSGVISLPADDEAGPDGAFGRESFLRALVVQLAQTVELVDGPGTADAIVAQVGADVGGRMEDAFRAARSIDGELELDQLAELMVGLKRAIGGGFSIVEADERRIVLQNTSCPFGDVVTRAPALCRMTSSVFGGIARRNRGAAAVDLEQRIAVGDHQCRVTVWLTEPGPEREPFLHLYGAFDERPVEVAPPGR